MSVGGSLATAAYLRRSRRRGHRSSLVVLALVVALLGGVALGAFAGARRTASAYPRYLEAYRLSDLAVNTPVGGLARVAAIGALPGVASSANYVGLFGNPVIGGEERDDFELNGLFGSTDGRLFRQDRAVVTAGRLPDVEAPDEIALTPRIAAAFGVGVGGRVTYVIHDSDGGEELTRPTFRVVGLATMPPALADDVDALDGGILPPAATERFPESIFYSWQGIVLDKGTSVDAFVDEIAHDPSVNEIPPIIDRISDTTAKLQRAIRPQVTALGLFAVAVAAAMVVLVGQAVARQGRDRQDELATWSELGVRRVEATQAAVVPIVASIALGTVLAVVFAALVSPLAPIGSVRGIDPGAGFNIDAAALLGGAAVLLGTCTALAVVLTWLSVGIKADRAVRSSRLVLLIRQAGVAPSGLVGISDALGAGTTRARSTARTTTVSAIVALTAVTAALLFGASLHQLVSVPDHYGWAWDRYVVASAGYGKLDPAVVTPLVDADGLDGWSLFAFASVSVDDTPVPAMGVQRETGDVAPPTRTGRPVSGPDEIALGSTTMADLGVGLGDSVTVSSDGGAREMTVVSTVVFPSVGVLNTEHPSLGRGALLDYDAMAAIVSAESPCTSEGGLCPQAAAFRFAPDVSASRRDRVVRQIVDADPDGTPGGTFEQALLQSTEIRNERDIGRIPVVLAGAMALGALLSVALGLVASVRYRRRELAALKAVGFTARNCRASVAWQALTTMVIACLVGVPLGLLAGSRLWAVFAGDLGVDTAASSAVPIVLGVAIVSLAAGAVTAGVPARLAARTPVASTLRTE